MVNKKSHLAAVALASLVGFTINGACGASYTPDGQSRFANSNLLLRGPIENIDAASSRILVLGQWLPVTASQIASSKVGQFVAVYGSLTSSGKYVISALLHIDSIRYVPGATNVFIKGLVSSADRSAGSLRIGALSVDYTAALSQRGDLVISKGEEVALRGWQYGEFGSVYAQSAAVIPSARNVGMLGQTGSGATAMGQTGSGATAMGQTGSGAFTMGQTGSGAHSLGQTGSGATAMGQTGSGATAMGQTGSGATAMGQTGSGATAMGQTGSGATAMGQTGSGATAMGQTGSGAFTMGQTGSGATAMGQTGSGATAMGQTGSGATAMGQTGSGATAMGQTGSGVAGR